jgi:phytoene dehydrogenase-like protein
MENSIIIIGGGISGLATGCYGRMNNYNTRILEMHHLPGGVCVPRKKNGYIFDSRTDWFLDSRPGILAHDIWKELGVLQNRHMINYEEYLRIKDSEQNLLILYTNIDHLENHLLDLSFKDVNLIREFCDCMREVKKINARDIIFFEEMGFFNKLKAVTRSSILSPLIRKYKDLTMYEFSQLFKDKFLQRAFGNIFISSNISVIILITLLALQDIGFSGYPLGGSSEIIEDMKKRYEDLDGCIEYQSRVEKIIIKGNRAIGVQLNNGKKYYADYIISAADGYSTLFEMLEGKYINTEIKAYYDYKLTASPFLTLDLGVNQDLSNEPHSIIYLINNPVKIAEREINSLNIKHFCFDSRFAPPGKSIVNTMIPTDFHYWENLALHPSLYKEEKIKIANLLISKIDFLYNAIKENLEIWDIMTPIDFGQCNGNWKGSFRGWLPTPEAISLKINKNLPGLSNFYHVGQWIVPGGGFFRNVYTGRQVIQILCKKDKKQFTIKYPM